MPYLPWDPPPWLPPPRLRMLAPGMARSYGIELEPPLQFFIEAVLDTRPSPTPPTREYHLKWADYSSECNTWETLAGLFDTEGQCVAFLEHCFNNGLLSPGEATVEAIAFVGGSGLPSSGDDDGDDGVEGAGDSEEDQDDDDSNEDEGDESDDDEEDDINDEAEDDEHHSDYIADVLGSRTTNGHTEYLVQWEGDAYSEAHWMTLEDLMADLDERAEFVAQWAGRRVLVKKPEAEGEGGAEAEPEGADGFNTVGSSASASSEHELSQPTGVDEDQEGDEEDAQGEDAHDEEYDDDDDTEMDILDKRTIQTPSGPVDEYLVKWVDDEGVELTTWEVLETWCEEADAAEEWKAWYAEKVKGEEMETMETVETA